jgi:hypothetical protein
VDDERELETDTNVQDTQSPPQSEGEASVARGGMFAADPAEQHEALRAVRRRAMIWGLAAGGVMSLILVLCAVLLYLLGTSNG